MFLRTLTSMHTHVQKRTPRYPHCSWGLNHSSNCFEHQNKMFEPMTENEAGLSGGFNGQKTKKKKTFSNVQQSRSILESYNLQLTTQSFNQNFDQSKISPISVFIDTFQSFDCVYIQLSILT